MKYAISILGIIFLMGLASQARAIDEPENVIKYRQGVMKASFGGFYAPNITPDPGRGADRS